MKFLLCVFVAVLCACAWAKFVYTLPMAPCKWGMTVETLSASEHRTEKHWVFGRYKKIEKYNHNNDLIEVEAFRPDLISSETDTYGRNKDAHFWSSALSCTVESAGPYISHTYGGVVAFNEKAFDHAERTTYNNKDCVVYFDNAANGDPVKGKNLNAYYVDMDGYLIGYVSHADDWESRVYVNYTYHSGSRVALSDFSFSKSFAYRCPDERIYHNPDAYFAHCAAGTTRVVVGVVAASLLAVLALVF